METERHIEKLLRAFSKKRKADAGTDLELHPANRRLLEDEVKRSTKSTSAERSSFWQMLFGSTPRLAVSLSVVVGLVLLTVNYFIQPPQSAESKSETMLAQNNPSATEDLKKAEAPAMSATPAVVTVDEPVPVVTTPESEPLPAPAPEIASSKLESSDAIVMNDRSGLREALDKQVTQKLADAPIVNAPTLASQDTGGGFGGGGGRGAGGGRGGRGGGGGGFGGGRGGARQAGPIPAEQPVDTTAASASTIARATASSVNRTSDSSSTTGSRANSSTESNVVRFQNRAVLDRTRIGANAQTQMFYRSQVADGNNAVPTVLNSFSVEQRGDRIKVVDADGSEYTGVIQAEATAQGNKDSYQMYAAPAARAMGGAAAPQRRDVVPPGNAASFAIEIQRPLAQQNYAFRVTGTNRTVNQVVIFNGSLEVNTNAASTNFGFFDATNSVDDRLRIMQNLPLSKLRITGDAEVGGDSSIKIDAAPVSP